MRTEERVQPLLYLSISGEKTGIRKKQLETCGDKLALRGVTPMHHPQRAGRGACEAVTSAIDFKVVRFVCIL